MIIQFDHFDEDSILLKAQGLNPRLTSSEFDFIDVPYEAFPGWGGFFNLASNEDVLRKVIQEHFERHNPGILLPDFSFQDFPDFGSLSEGN